MKINAVWEGRMKFTATGESGHSVLMDASLEAGGEGRGPKPVEMVLMGLAACSGIDVVNILTKMRENIDGFSMEVDADRNATEPRRFTAIRLLFRLTGNIKPGSAERAIRLSLEKYCSVSNSLNAEFSFAYQVNDERYPATGFFA